VRQAIASATTQPIRVPTVGGFSFAWMEARRRTPLTLLAWTTAEHADSASTHARLRRAKRKRSSGCASEPVVVQTKSVDDPVVDCCIVLSGSPESRRRLSAAGAAASNTTGANA
jgi:hypothetical protein